MLSIRAADLLNSGRGEFLSDHLQYPVCGRQRAAGGRLARLLFGEGVGCAKVYTKHKINKKGPIDRNGILVASRGRDRKLQLMLNYAPPFSLYFFSRISRLRSAGGVRTKNVTGG